VAAVKDKISEEDIAYFVKKRKVPAKSANCTLRSKLRPEKTPL
jgi:hypothetical protein